MALPAPTSLVTANLTVTLADLLTSVTLMSRISPSVPFKALNVQYQGNIFIPLNSTQNFVPAVPVVLWAFAYVRNIGGAGGGNAVLSVTPSGGAAANVVNLDVGGVFLYASPALSALVINGIAPGLSNVQIAMGATTLGSFEVLLAG